MRPKIQQAQYEAAYQKGRELFASGNKGITAALGVLKKKTGINRASASNYIHNLRHMLRGECYRRKMNVESTDDFLTWIYRDEGSEGLKNALSALGKHIQYLQEPRPTPMSDHVALLAKYRGYPPSAGGSISALRDLLDPPLGNVSPDRAERINKVIKRDQKVRDYVIKLANGRCEYCGCEGFSLPDGTNYVEAHHVIALAEDGADTVENVIALCSNHHREAHFGTGAAALEQRFIEKIAERNAP